MNIDSNTQGSPLPSQGSGATPMVPSEPEEQDEEFYILEEEEENEEEDLLSMGTVSPFQISGAIYPIQTGKMPLTGHPSLTPPPTVPMPKRRRITSFYILIILAAISIV
ncbi:MAG: hypothetical protein ACRDHZ_23520, partial [Ktedonobacteraceae bacterium]